MATFVYDRKTKKYKRYSDAEYAELKRSREVRVTARNGVPIETPPASPISKAFSSQTPMVTVTSYAGPKVIERKDVSASDVMYWSNVQAGLKKEGKVLLTPAMAKEKGLISQRDKERLERENQMVTATGEEVMQAQSAKSELRKSYPYAVTPQGGTPLQTLERQTEQEKDVKARRGAALPESEVYYATRGNIPGVIGDVIDVSATVLTTGIPAALAKRQKEKEQFIRETIVEPQASWSIESGDPRVKIEVPGELAGVSTKYLGGQAAGAAIAVGGAVFVPAAYAAGAAFTGITLGEAVKEPTAYNIAKAGLTAGLLGVPSLATKGGRANVAALTKGRVGKAVKLPPKVEIVEYGAASIRGGKPVPASLNLKATLVGEGKARLYGEQAFGLVKETPGKLITERSTAARLGLTKPRVTDIKPTRETLVWKKTETVSADMTTGKVRAVRGVRGFQKKEDIDTILSGVSSRVRVTRFTREGKPVARIVRGAGEVSRNLGDATTRRFQRTIYDRTTNLPRGGGRITKGGPPEPPKGGIIKLSDITKAEPAPKGTIETGRGARLIQETKTEKPPRIDEGDITGGRGRANVRTSPELKGGKVGPDVLIGRPSGRLPFILSGMSEKSLTRTGTEFRSLQVTSVKQKSAFGIREASKSAFKTDTALGIRSAQLPRQRQSQASALGTAALLGSASLTSGRPSKADFSITGGISSEDDIFGRRQKFGRRYKYTPSLAGMISGKTIKRAPKGTLTGLEIRYPVRNAKKLGVF